MRKDPAYRLLVIYILLAAALLLLPAIIMTCRAQQFDWKQRIPSASLVFAAGGFEGIMDHLQFHYDRPDPFWNPDISWKNKYRGGDPANGRTFAGKYAVWTTDGWHLMKAGRNSTLAVAIVLHPKEKGRKWWSYALEAIGYWAVNRAGFNVTYNLIKLPR